MLVRHIHHSETPEDIEYNGEDALYGYCPRCGELLISIWTPLYCGDCGQKIEWSERRSDETD